MSSWVLCHFDILITSLITGIITFIAGIISAIIYIRDPLTDPFILEIFVPDAHLNHPIGFKVKNTTQHSLITDITITPIVNDAEQSIQKYYEVLNPDGEYMLKQITGNYNNIRDINSMHGFTGASYQENKQPLKFELIARFKNNRFRVMKIHNTTKILTAYDPSTRKFRQIE